MICRAARSQEHAFVRPWPDRNIEQCEICGVYRIHSRDRVVWLPPANPLPGIQDQFLPAAGRLLFFRRRS